MDFNTVDIIKSICESVIPSYGFYYEDRQLMNVKADNSPFPLVLFEEVREGNYSINSWLKKTTKAQLYFCRISLENAPRIEIHANASEREDIRNLIENEAIRPFIKAFNESGKFEPVRGWKFFTPPARFDANEVSILLQFDATQTGCL